MQDAWQRAFALFNSARFFDAHEAFEDLWREAPHDALHKQHLQGLVQLAVAFHHQSTGNLEGACSVLERALRNLNGAEESFPELDLVGLRAELNPWRDYLVKNLQKPEGPAPELPKLLLRNSTNPRFDWR